MFKNIFSFEGRIRRTEYGVSLIIYSVVAVIVNAIIESSNDAAILGLAYIPMLWFLWAQGAKRCHDVGNSGWFILIPFYGLFLIFQDGQAGSNQYGENPKGIQVIGGQTFQVGQNTGTSGGYQGDQNKGTSGGYQGGYSGGHNSPNTNYSSTETPTKSDGYNDGDLYK
jgi:uncharacterized membrane protein YhaH (DUF805 family)